MSRKIYFDIRGTILEGYNIVSNVWGHKVSVNQRKREVYVAYCVIDFFLHGYHCKSTENVAFDKSTLCKFANQKMYLRSQPPLIQLLPKHTSLHFLF